jgi:two-component system sensor histidine kinase PilS (NtrC family)
LFLPYALLTVATAMYVITGSRRSLARPMAFMMGLLFLIEIAADTVIIEATGAINSPFSALFILTIVSAALAYRLVGTLLVASLASLSYSYVVWLDHSPAISAGKMKGALESALGAGDSVFYSVFLHLLIFYLIAFVSGYLAERIRQRDRQLADTSRALQRAKLDTDDILRHLNSGLLTIDTEGRIIFFNRAAERILGYREEEVKGLPCVDAFSERMPSLARTLMQRLEDGRHAPRMEISIVCSDGTIVPLGLSTSGLMERPGVMRGVIAIFTDLSDAKRLEAKVRAHDRLAAVGELSASIAHEIRNPLAAISGSVELLKRELQVSGDCERLMDLIVKESDRLSIITTEFLEYARIDSPVFTKVELCHLVGDVIQVLHHHPNFRDHVRLVIDADDATVYAVADDHLTRQLVMNLATNALEAIESKSGTVTFRLTTDRDGGTVALHVQDDGPGIPKENLRSLYQPFFSTKKHGTGLGLAIAHRVAVAQKLKLAVSSEVGVGTTFVIEFNLWRPNRVDDSHEYAPAMTSSPLI